MTPAVLDKVYTPEDLLLLEDAHRYELIDGRLVERAMGAKAGWVVAAVIELLRAHVRSQRLGWMFSSDCGYQVHPTRANLVRYPDASFIAKGRLPNDKVPEGHVRIPPDLAVEVISPNDLAEEVDEKVEEYLKVGIPLVWVFFPKTQCVMVYRKDGTVSRLRDADVLSGETSVPGFTCRVAEVFADTV